MKRIVALTEVSLIEALLFIISWYFQAIFGTGYGWHSKVAMILLALAGIFAHRGLRDYGLLPAGTRLDIKWGFRITLLFTLACAGLMALNPGKIDALNMAVDVIWFFIFVGFAEELFFRGYVQTRLNQVFTKKYSEILGTKFEWTQGTLITGVVFFGLPHLIVGINPFTSTFVLTFSHVAMTVAAAFLGVIFGVLREKTGDIYLPALLHGFIDFTTYGMAKVVGILLSAIATMVTLFVFFALFFEKILTETEY